MTGSLDASRSILEDENICFYLGAVGHAVWLGASQLFLRNPGVCSSFSMSCCVDLSRNVGQTVLLLAVCQKLALSGLVMTMVALSGSAISGQV